MLNVLYDAEPLVEWCRREKELLQRQIEMLRGGDLWTHARQLGQPSRDTTAESLAEAERKLAELETLLRNSQPPGFQRQVHS